jgi:hypothetical protein
MIPSLLWISKAFSTNQLDLFTAARNNVITYILIKRFYPHIVYVMVRRVRLLSLFRRKRVAWKR